MLINLSNHPFIKWPIEQRETAIEEYDAVIDLPFPQISPSLTLEEVKIIVNEYIEKVFILIGKGTKDKFNAIHIMGEFTFSFQFVNEMGKKNILCVASTTERVVTENPDSSKTTRFKFVQFRPYY